MGCWQSRYLVTGPMSETGNERGENKGLPVIGHDEEPPLKVGPTCLILIQLAPDPSHAAAVEGAFPRYQMIGP